jgi:hypothetical protein
LNAMLGLNVFGMPGLYVAVRGKYPRWGKGAKAFNSGTVATAGGKSNLDDGITVETDVFEHRQVKPHFINPCCFGEDFAAWFENRSRLSKVMASDYRKSSRKTTAGFLGFARQRSVLGGALIPW